MGLLRTVVKQAVLAAVVVIAQRVATRVINRFAGRDRRKLLTSR